jgi:hypothetical protein
MTSGLGSEVGAALKGAAKLVTALAVIAGIYFGVRQNSPEDDLPVVVAQRSMQTQSDMAVSPLDVEVAETAMKKARKRAVAHRCIDSQPEKYDRGEITYEKAQGHQAAGRNSEAIRGFSEAAAYYNQCV